MAKSVPFGRTLDLSQLLEQAVALHQRGQLAEAERLYRQVLNARADNFEARHLLGLLRYQQGRNREALDLIGAALKLRPDSIIALSNYGLALEAAQRFDDALASFDKALALRPDFADAHNNRGNVLSALKRQEEALASYDKALALKPAYPEALNNRGNVLAQLERHDEALPSFDQALAIWPQYAEALYNRGNALSALERQEDALASYDRALVLRADYPEALDNRGNVLAKLGRYEEALASHDAALRVRPDHPETLSNRGTTLEQLWRCEEALASYDRALALQPRHAEALGNRGNVLAKLKHYEAALESYDAALAIRADDADAWYNRGNALSALRRYEDAAASYETALAIDPAHADAHGGLAGVALAICDWERTTRIGTELANQITAKTSTVGPFALLGYSDDPALLLQCAQQFVAQQLTAPLPRVGTVPNRHHDKIRLAYLSADFRDHVMAYQLAELFERHDKSRFDITGVSFGIDDGSEMRARLATSFDRFLDVRGKSDRDVAEALAELGIDIAVDLMGHTRDARLRIFAHHPAPIQVNYLGYAGTIGADFIDYIIGDPVVLPFEHEPFYREKIVQLPDTFFVTDSKRAIAPHARSRADEGLPEQGFVFCCFNNSAKIGPAIFDIWMRLLQAVDGSALWLSLRHGAAKDNLLREAAARGVAPERLVFAKHAPRIEDHLARHRLADLFLDTLPYNAHATAIDALWAGLPVLTCRGNAYGARVGASLLRAVGLPELITESLADYEALALRLARHPAQLRGIREKLAQHRHTHPLFDTDRFRRHIEAAYTTMWDIHQRGEPPQSFAAAAASD